ncbi:MAG TPA: hypothetical protein VG537_05800, partial [Candidatus Kapabacteria bacterium]|nr:hypothetical protein [Candidatus Kapabacteria bacterium]
SSGIKTGFNTTTPAQPIDVSGNLRFSGALKPNGSNGSSGQYLLSAGSVSPPTWGAITISTGNWKLAGNSATSPTTNYIGTTDVQDFVVRTSAIERARITSAGLIGVNTSSPAHQLASVLSTTTDETAAVYGEASGGTASRDAGVWGSVNNTSTANTGTIAVLATGSGNTSSGSTDVAVQVSSGELAMGRGTQTPSAGTVVEGAAAGTAYSAAGPSGVVQLSLNTDLTSASPLNGVYQDLGTVTINNRYITANSIIIANIITKTNGGGNPDPNNSIFRVNVESRTANSCVLRIGMIPFVTDPGTYQGSDYIRIGYLIVNPGR